MSGRGWGMNTSIKGNYLIWSSVKLTKRNHSSILCRGSLGFFLRRKNGPHAIVPLFVWNARLEKIIYSWNPDGGSKSRVFSYLGIQQPKEPCDRPKNKRWCNLFVTEIFAINGVIPSTEIQKVPKYLRNQEWYDYTWDIDESFHSGFLTWCRDILTLISRLFSFEYQALEYSDFLRVSGIDQVHIPVLLDSNNNSRWGFCYKLTREQAYTNASMIFL
jgi:hypothetical protein